MSKNCQAFFVLSFQGVGARLERSHLRQARHLLPGAVLRQVRKLKLTRNRTHTSEFLKWPLSAYGAIPERFRSGGRGSAGGTSRGQRSCKVGGEQTINHELSEFVSLTVCCQSDVPRSHPHPGRLPQVVQRPLLKGLPKDRTGGLHSGHHLRQNIPHHHFPTRNETSFFKNILNSGMSRKALREFREDWNTGGDSDLNLYLCTVYGGNFFWGGKSR